MKITQEDITTAANLFLVVGGLITLAGSLLVYFSKVRKGKKKK